MLRYVMMRIVVAVNRGRPAEPNGRHPSVVPAGRRIPDDAVWIGKIVELAATC